MRTEIIQVTFTQEDDSEVSLEVNPPLIPRYKGELVTYKWNFTKVPANCNASMSIVLPSDTWKGSWPDWSDGPDNRPPTNGPDGWTAVALLDREIPGAYQLFVQVEFEIPGACGGAYKLRYRQFFPAGPMDWSNRGLYAHPYNGAIEIASTPLSAPANIETDLIFYTHYLPDYKPARPYLRPISGQWPGRKTPVLKPGTPDPKIEASFLGNGAYTYFAGFKNPKQPALTVWFNGVIETTA